MGKVLKAPCPEQSKCLESVRVFIIIIIITVLLMNSVSEHFVPMKKKIQKPN
jgi:hypothetical protein